MDVENKEVRCSFTVAELRKLMAGVDLAQKMNGQAMAEGGLNVSEKVVELTTSNLALARKLSELLKPFTKEAQERAANEAAAAAVKEAPKRSPNRKERRANGAAAH